VLAAAPSPLLAVVEHDGEHGLKSLGLKKPLGKVLGNEIVQLLHWDGPTRHAVWPWRALIEHV
jgi:hypothetical protein